MIDARNKIIQKHRAKIFDARDKLAQIAKRNGDVRRKLVQKGLDKPIKPIPSYKNRQTYANIVEQPAPRQPKPIRRQYKTPAYIEHDIRMDVDADYLPALRRTVKNDVSYAARMPPLPTFKHIEDPRQQMVDSGWSGGGPDPFDCYEVPLSRPYDVSEPRNLNRQQVSGHQVLSQKPILRASPDSRYRYSDMALPQRGYEQERYRDTNHLSYEMRSRLHHSPDPTQSMGMFSNPYASRPDEVKQKPGYRIVVSNLHSSVSQNDVKVHTYI